MKDNLRQEILALRAALRVGTKNIFTQNPVPEASGSGLVDRARGFDLVTPPVDLLISEGNRKARDIKVLDPFGKATIDLRSIPHQFETVPPYDRLNVSDASGIAVVSLSSGGTLSTKSVSAGDGRFRQAADGTAEPEITS